MTNTFRPLVQELAIGAIAAITITSMFFGCNPTFLITGISAIAGIAGYTIRASNRTH